MRLTHYLSTILAIALICSAAPQPAACGTYQYEIKQISPGDTDTGTSTSSNAQKPSKRDLPPAGAPYNHQTRTQDKKQEKK